MAMARCRVSPGTPDTVLVLVLLCSMDYDLGCLRAESEVLEVSEMDDNDMKYFDPEVRLCHLDYLDMSASPT